MDIVLRGARRKNRGDVLRRQASATGAEYDARLDEELEMLEQP